ncbi:MAG: elongation factor G [Hyphomicrobiaceae bacterium]|nr:MAG: elongation factor G [Hyphomicrobiaceae bacterium]
MGQAGQGGRGARCIAIVGPYLSGKTTLLESILARCGGISRQGTVAAKNTVGDASEEARSHGMSVELNVAEVDFLGDKYTFIDCPGSLEFQHEATAALTACDAAVVVCEADQKKIPALQLIMKQLEDRNIPRFLFLNKIDKIETRIRELLPILQPASAKPLVLRQVPIWENGIVTGFIDLALERAFIYREHAPSEVREIPKDMTDREHEARFSMLEKLADYDDALMEQLLSDVEPPRDRVFDDLSRELKDGLICPVLIGSAEKGNGILRLLKALRHEAPSVVETAKRLGVDGANSAGFVFKTLHSAHGGKQSLTRLLAGEMAEGQTHNGKADDRIGGVASILGQDMKKRGPVKLGETAALAKLEHVKTGDTISTDKSTPPPIASPAPHEAVFGLSIGAKDKKDEVKLTTALSRIVEEDPSLAVTHDASHGGLILMGQGEMHLRVALERLKRKFGIEATTKRREVPYKESIRKPISIRGRHKKQSGGHGQFGDVVLDIKPMQRGGGFQFSDSITGGVVPKQYIPSVEIGVSDYLHKGPLGFPVVDVQVTLTDGSYHSVDSSDMAFRQAGRLAMSEGMPKCSPVLLEPIMQVEITIPNEATAKINGIVSQRRGQILGFDARPGWPGWDVVEAHIPEAEMQDLIIEVRSATSGVGSYTAKFHHLAELTGRLADHVLTAHKPAAA